MKTLVAVCALVAWAGCGSSKVQTREYEESQVETLTKSFVAVVEKHYAGRNDGVLTFAPSRNRMRGHFHYKETVDGVRGEIIELTFKKFGTTSVVSSETGKRRTTKKYKIVAREVERGSDKTLLELSNQILAETDAMAARSTGKSGQ